MIGGPQQQAMMPAAYGGFGMGQMGFGGQGMSPMGFGGLNGYDPTSINNQMTALSQQTQMQGNMFVQMQNMIGMMMQMMMMQQMMSSLANFGGGGASGGSPGISDFLGGGGGASDGNFAPVSGGGGGGGSEAVGGSSAPAATDSDFGSIPGWGAALAKDAEKHATGPGGLCFRYVRQALERAGVKGVGGASAYMAADQLAKNPKFREVKVDPKDFKKLPAGAVVVWNRGNGHEHGHISIALGNGKEASDKIRNQITNYGTSARVFLPK